MNPHPLILFVPTMRSEKMEYEIRRQQSEARQRNVNFINILRAAFEHDDPKNSKSVKNTGKLSVFFMLLETARIKALSRMLMKLPLEAR